MRNYTAVIKEITANAAAPEGDTSINIKYDLKHRLLSFLERQGQISIQVSWAYNMIHLEIPLSCKNIYPKCFSQSLVIYAKKNILYPNLNPDFPSGQRKCTVIHFKAHCDGRARPLRCRTDRPKQFHSKIATDKIPIKNLCSFFIFYSFLKVVHFWIKDEFKNRKAFPDIYYWRCPLELPH